MNIAWTKTGFTSGTKDGNSSYGNSSLIGLKIYDRHMPK
jgi:hypothetical protein